MTINLSSNFNLELFNALTPPKAKKLLKKQGKEVDSLIKRIPDLKSKELSLVLGCQLILQLYNSDHIERMSEAMAEVGVWPDSIWKRTGADQIAIVNIIKNIATSILPRDRSKERILIDSFSTAIIKGNKPAAIEILEHLPKIPPELGYIFNEGSALGAAIAHLPDPHFLELVFHKEKWDLKTIKNLIHKGDALDCKIAVVAYALFKSDTELLTFALAPENHPFLHYKNKTLLHYACSIGNQKFVKNLLDLGFNANQNDKWGYKPISFAKNIPTIDLLLDAGANVEEECSKGSTPLLNAIMVKCTDSIVSHFLDRGAKPSFGILNAYLSRHIVNPNLAKRLLPSKEECIQRCISRPKTIPFILEKYPDIKPQLKQQVIPLLEIIHFQDDYKSFLETIKLMDWGYDKFKALIEKNKRGFLDYACKESDVELFKWLVEFGAKPSYKGLLAAKKESSQELVELYIKHINTVDEKGDTFIHKLIADKGSVEDLKQLIAMGADIEAKNATGTALANACVFGDAQTREVLVNAGADVKQAFGVLKRMDEGLHDFLYLILSKYPNYYREVFVALRGLTNSDLLHRACSSGDLCSVKNLLLEGFDVNESLKGYGFTPIFFAKDEKTIDLLLTAGANINQSVRANSSSSRVSTPLKIAIETGNPMVAYLLERGAKPTFENLLEYMSRSGEKDPLAIEQFVLHKEIFSSESLSNLLAYPEILAAILKKYPGLEPAFKSRFLENNHLKTSYRLILLMGWGDQHLVNFLHGHERDFFIEASKESKVDIAKQLIVLGAKPDSISYFEAAKVNSPELMNLHQTNHKDPGRIFIDLFHSGRCSLENVQQLISMGFNVNAKISFEKQFITPLEVVCLHGYVSGIRTLIHLGADIKPVLQTKTLTNLQAELPVLMDLVLQKDPNFKDELITAIKAIPDTSLNSGVLRTAIRLNLTDVVKRCIQQRTDFLRMDSQGRSALDDMLAYEMDVVDIVNNIPEKERLKATKGVKSLVEAEVTKVSLSDLALALSVSKRRKILLRFKSLEFITGNLMVFFAKFSFQHISFQERYDTWKRFSSTLQREYMSFLSSTEQTKIASDYLQDKPDVRVQINNLKNELPKFQNKFGKLREISTNEPEEPFKDADAALVVLKNKKASLTDRFEALKFFANTVTEKTFPAERFKEIEDAIIDFNKKVGAFDVKLLSFGQKLKELPQWHPSVRQMQEKDYSDMMNAQRTIKENMSGTSQVILAKIAKDMTIDTTIDFPSKIETLKSVEPEMFEESYLALVTNPQYLVYLKSWTPQNDREIYTENFNQIPELIKDLKNASGNPIKDDDRIDYDTLYKLIYGLPHLALQKKIFGEAFGELLLVLSVKLEKSN